MFQFGYECFMNYFKHLETNNEVPEQDDVLDASYCLVRLGDIFYTNHQFEMSSKVCLTPKISYFRTMKTQLS